MLKKITALFLSIIFILSFTACSGKKEDSKSETSSNKYENTYEYSLLVKEEYGNKRVYYSQDDLTIDLCNGFCTSELKTICDIYKTSDDYKDNIDDSKEDFEERIEDNKYEYGDNYKFEYKIEESKKLHKDEIEEFSDTLKSETEDLEDAIAEIEDWDSVDWEVFADDLNINVSNAKKLIKNLKSISEKISKAKINEGYVVEYTFSITGDEIDDPSEYEESSSYAVYKIDGRWVDATTLRSISSLNYLL